MHKDRGVRGLRRHGAVVLLSDLDQTLPFFGGRLLTPTLTPCPVGRLQKQGDRRYMALQSLS